LNVSLIFFTVEKKDILKLLFRIFCRLEVPLVNNDNDGNGADGRHQEHDVEPTMVKIKLKLAQNFSYNCPTEEKFKIGYIIFLEVTIRRVRAVVLNLFELAAH
jgi:hypothetical protein